MGKENETSQWFRIAIAIEEFLTENKGPIAMDYLIRVTGVTDPHKIQTLLQQRFYGVFKREVDRSHDQFVFSSDDYKDTFLEDMRILKRDMQRRRKGSI